MEPPRENSPSTPSRFLNSYLGQTEIYSQGFTQRSLPGQQPFYADNLTTPNNKYLKRPHHQSFDKGDNEREKKYDKKLDDNGDNKYLHQQHSYDSYSSDNYSTTNLSASGNSAATGTSSSQKTTNSSSAGGGTGSGTTATAAAASGTKNLANGKKTKGRVKIKMEYIDNKLRRYTTFSKRKTGIMKKVSHSFAL